MKEFLMVNWVSIVIVAVFAGYAIFLAVTNQWTKLRAVGYKLMLQAEKAITGTKVGQERFEAVFKQVYTLVPAWLRLFVSEETLKEKLQEWYNDIKDSLSNGQTKK